MTQPIEKSKVTTEPAQEPCTLAELKQRLRITSTSTDAQLTAFLVSARLRAEQYMGRKCITQTITAYFDQPATTGRAEIWEGTREMSANCLNRYSDYLSLQYAPLQSIASISSYGSDNTETAYSNTNYVTDNATDEKGGVFLNSSASWPLNLREYNGLEIVYVSGYGDDPADVPQSIKEGIYQDAMYLFNNAECSSQDELADSALPWLARYRIHPV